MLASSGCASEPAAVPAPTQPCNGDARLCNRRMDEVVFATAHNGMSNKAEGFILPNQPDGQLAQLDAGLRGFMLDVHPYDGNIAAEKDKPYLCHATCKIGARDFVAAMTELRVWMDAHRREVIVIIFEDYVSEEVLDAALGAAGLLPHCLHVDPAAPMPTLAQAIAQDRRLLLMTESGGGKLAWNHSYAALAFDTPYAAATTADFSCAVLRGQPTNKLFVVNHFLTHNLDSHAELAKLANHNPLLLDRVRQCEKERARKANLIAVDWYTEGDVLAAVRTLNGLD